MSSESEDEFVLCAYYFIKCSEQRNKRSFWVHPINKIRSEKNTLCKFYNELRCDDDKFYNYVRMKPTTFDLLLNIVGASLQKFDTNYRKSITPKERLFVTLRFLATGHQFRLGASTIRTIVIEICSIIWKLVSPIYMQKPDLQNWKGISDGFENHWNFPNCVGAVDGKHIRMQRPSFAGSEFYNYKSFHSILLQAVVDAEGNFVCVDVGDYGRSSDGGFLQHSTFGKGLMNDTLNLPPSRKICNEIPELPFVFVADEAYPLKRNILRPFARKSLTSEKRIFNYRLSRARRLVECAFGMVTRKFRLFEGTIIGMPENVEKFVLAACTLHNFIRKVENGGNNSIAEVHNYLNSGKIYEMGRLSSAHKATNTALAVRNNFTTYFNSPAGSVPWQNNYI